MRDRGRAQLILAFLAMGLLSACAGSSSSDDIVREPGFRASAIRRPALLVRVAVDEDLSARERARIPEDYQAAIVEGLDRMGILLVDVATVPPSRSRALQGIDRPPALTRAREAGAQGMICETYEPQREAPLRLHAGVGLGACDPMTVRLLPCDQPVRRRAYGRYMRSIRIVCWVFGALVERRCGHRP